MPGPSDHQEFFSHFGTRGSSNNGRAPLEPDQVNLSQIYTLVDSVLPFEACLYYQVLPLFIKGSRLVVGMVNPEDRAASEYVKKQLSYINYSIEFRPIQSDWHRDLLSKYLSHNAKTSQLPQDTAANTAVEDPQSSSAWPYAEASVEEYGMQNTFIVDQPDEILEGTSRELLEPVNPAKNTPPGELPTFVTESSASINGASSFPISSNNSDVSPLHLEVDHQYRHANENQLLTLPPKALMQALLTKILAEGIGRLYFERRLETGRILWSKDGILQAVLESVEGQVFQDVINEFKLLTHLSLNTFKKPKQVEIERAYGGQRILLRFRVMPGTYGEEATLQVLRGTALKFYQQQQLDKLGRDALDAAQKLQCRLKEIQERARRSLNFQAARSETLPAIIQLLKQIEGQVQDIVAAYDQAEQGNGPENWQDR